MSFWIFKVADQRKYPDVFGKSYVYDNTHSIHVKEGDSFIYLDKRNSLYGFAGHGTVDKVSRVPVIESERGNSKIKFVYTAKLTDFVEYEIAFDIRRNKAGMKNRSLLGIYDVNLMGWSASIARLTREMYENILQLVYESGNVIIPPSNEYEVSDNWSVVRARHSLERFRRQVLTRQNSTCVICGTGVAEILEVAHISPYASDKANRSNPANGLGLCSYCHKAYDRQLISINEDGSIDFEKIISQDPIANSHVSRLNPKERKKLLEGVDVHLLRRRRIRN